MYERVGGTAWFEELVARFYDGVETDPVLRPLYPGDDLTDAREHLCGFLVQYWGGPTTYSEERGHPRLRMRHMPFVIGEAERDAWYRHMAAAVTQSRPRRRARDARLLRQRGRAPGEPPLTVI